MSARSSIETEIQRIRARISEILSASDNSPSARRSLDKELREIASEVEAALAKIDPVSLPDSVFDPSNPKIIGRFTALALVAQKLLPLSQIGRFYGSGVYAIYYTGDFPLYAPISKTESPIYVGQAAPKLRNAVNPRDQGPRLTDRLGEHRKNIEKASTTLNIGDFYARFLVVQSGWETAAEDYLIQLFRPIWNSETKVLFGLGKHGDDAVTRANKRSPWDTIHPGRKWAEASKEDSKTVAEIELGLDAHFSLHPAYQRQTDLLDTFISELRQG